MSPRVFPGGVPSHLRRKSPFGRRAESVRSRWCALVEPVQSPLRRAEVRLMRLERTRFPVKLDSYCPNTLNQRERGREWEAFLDRGQSTRRYLALHSHARLTPEYLLSMRQLQ